MPLVLAGAVAVGVCLVGLMLYVVTWSPGRRTRTNEAPKAAPEERAEAGDQPDGDGRSAAHGAPPIAASETAYGGSALAARVKLVFEAHCKKCHGQGKAKGGIRVLDRELLVEKQKVVPGKPGDSVLFQLVTADDDSAMPPPDQTRLSGEQVEIIRAWIAAGAPAFPAEAPNIVESPKDPAKDGTRVRDIVTADYALRAILKDVRSLPTEDRPFARYFSLTHLMTGGVEAGELELHRDALAKAINHLCWERDLVLPRPIDRDRTIYSVDIRGLGWDQRPFERIIPRRSVDRSPINLYDLVLLEYPYGVVYEDSDTFDLLAEEYLRPAGLVLPVLHVRADWFVSVATQPPLYEDLLRLPSQLKRLEERLHVDSQGNLEGGRARRAGVVISGVSRNNRAIERHPAAYGAYWKSFDFRSSKAEENLFRDPIDLRPAGGEMIFNLPNGLQGYLITDAKGSRLEAAPTEIVTDRFAEDKVVRNGLSCMRCHDAGIKGFADAVRAAVLRLPGSPGFDRRKVLQFYVGQAEMDGLLKQDAERFAAALRKALGKLQSKEPLTVATRRYLEEPIPLGAAAAELGIASAGELQSAFRAPKLVGLGLSPLAANGSVRRDAWEDSFNRVVRELGLGVPIVPLDGLTRRDVRPPGVDFDVALSTSKKNNVFAPGDKLVIFVTNPSRKDLYIELIGTSAEGRKTILAPATTIVGPGQRFRFPPSGEIEITGGLGREQITVFASDAGFPPGELLVGRDVADRVVHRYDERIQPVERRASPVEPPRVVKRTIEIETR